MGLFDFIKNQPSKVEINNLNEVLALSEIIQKSPDLPTLTNLYYQKKNFENPQIFYDFGIAFIIHGNNNLAKEALVKGASYGSKFPSQYFNTIFIDAIGQCFTLLLTQFRFNSGNAGDNIASTLAYLYLSNSINQNPLETYDSYRSRALLFKDNGNPYVKENIIKKLLGNTIPPEILLLSDFYLASQLTDSPHKDLIINANKLYNELADESYSEKMISNYTIEEIANIGVKLHNTLFEKIENKYRNTNLPLAISYNTLLNLIQ